MQVSAWPVLFDKSVGVDVVETSASAAEGPRSIGRVFPVANRIQAAAIIKLSTPSHVTTTRVLTHSRLDMILRSEPPKFQCHGYQDVAEPRYTQPK